MNDPAEPAPLRRDAADEPSAVDVDPTFAGTAFADGPRPEPTRRRRLAIGSAVAALVVVVIGSIVVLRGDERPDELAARKSGERPSTTQLETTSSVSAVPSTETSTTVPEEPTTVTTPVPDPTTTGPADGGDRRGAPPVPGGPGGGPKARLGTVRSWVFGLGVLDGGRSEDQIVASLRGVDLVVLDGVDASAGLVRRLQAQGSVVLGYLDVGAVEAGRPWSAAAAPYRSVYWEEWDEWFADVSNPGYRQLMTGTAAPPILAKGFDGLFLDVVDMVEQFPQHTNGMVQLVAELSAMARGRGGVLFMQNGDSVIDRFLPHIDGWNREDVSYTYDWDAKTYVPTPRQDREYALATIRKLKARGLFVSSVDYLSSPTAPNAAQARQAASGAGAVPTVSDIELTQLP